MYLNQTFILLFQKNITFHITTANNLLGETNKYMKRSILIFILSTTVFCLLLYYYPLVLLSLFLIAGVFCLIEISSAKKIYEFEDESDNSEDSEETKND